MCREPLLTAPRHAGFTLVELLVVIVILGLLATILTPTINAILQHTYQADTKQRIHGLTEGAEFFKQEVGWFPGQEDYALHSQNGTDYIYTGSQVLAARLFDLYHDDPGSPGHNPYHLLDPDDTGGTAHRAPQGRYAKYESGMLATVVDRDGVSRPFTIMDCFPRPHPIAYYMSASGIGTQQFHLQQNMAYTVPSSQDLGDQLDDFHALITDTRFPSNYLDPVDTSYKPSVRDGMFLLISPGIDGTWFNEDDVRNWNVSGS